MVLVFNFNNKQRNGEEEGGAVKVSYKQLQKYIILNIISFLN